MLLADAVYKDRDTGKTVLAGVFDEITTDPGKMTFTARAWLYLSLTDVSGKVDLVLRYVDLDTNEVLHEYGRAVIESNDRLATVEATIPLPFLPVPRSGTYAMELYSFGERVGSLRITAHTG
jgi:hypothetical protein